MKDIIYILVEDLTDLKFCEAIIEPILNNKYTAVLFYKYARKKKDRIKQFIKSLNYDKLDYYILGDIDKNYNIENALKLIYEKTGKITKKENIILVIKEIECWYLAGLSDDLIKRYTISLDLSDTQKYCKEDFDEIIPAGQSKIIFTNAILQTYNNKIAPSRNASLRCFLTKIS